MPQLSEGLLGCIFWQLTSCGVACDRAGGGGCEQIWKQKPLPALGRCGWVGVSKHKEDDGAIGYTSCSLVASPLGQVRAFVAF